MALSRKPIEIVEEGKHQLLTKAPHWGRVQLSYIAEVQNGFAFESELFSTSGGVPLIRIRDIDSESTQNFYVGKRLEEYIVRRGDILIGMDGDFHSAEWKGPDGLLNQRVCRIFLQSQNFDRKFLFICLQPFLNAINAETSSVTVKHLSSKTIAEIPLPLPPLAEQKRIVGKIEELFSELDKAVESLRTAQQQLKVYRQALLKHAFEGKLTSDWRAQNSDKLESAETLLTRIQQEREARYQGQLQEWKEAQQAWEASGKTGIKPATPKAPKTLLSPTAEALSELAELPEGWVYVRAEAITDFITKGTTPSRELLFDGAGEVPFIKVYNLTKTGALDFTISPTFVNQKTHSGFLSRSKVYPGDVLMNIVGPPLGKVSIVPDTYPEWNINQAIAIFRSKLVRNNLLSVFLSSEATVRRTMRKSKATAGQFNLTLEICRDILIPLCGMHEQKQLSQALDEKLSNLDQLEKNIVESLQQSETLRHSILKKAFSGKLVAQDPNDEPSSALLERICAERTAQPAKARGSRARAPA